MSYSEVDGNVTLTMSVLDYLLLLQIVGYGMGKGAGDSMPGSWIEFINRLNEGNPNFVPYKVPAEHGRT